MADKDDKSIINPYGRGVLNRGLPVKGTEPEDLASILDSGNNTGCEWMPVLEKLEFTQGSVNSDKLKTGRYTRILLTRAIFIKLEKTKCLFITARNVNANLLNIYSVSADDFFLLIQLLIDIRNELERRTKFSYDLEFASLSGKKPNSPLPKVILNFYPFADYKKWQETIKSRKKISSGNVLVLNPLPVVSAKEKLDQKSIDDSLDKIKEDADNLLKDLEINLAAKGDTPNINKAIKNLSSVTLKNVYDQTGEEIKNSNRRESPLINSTEIIIYGSVCPVVLDKKGNPYNLFGRLTYPILVPDPGSQMRSLYNLPGLYVSLGKYGNVNFQVDGTKIRKILFGGVASFEEYGYGYSGAHEFQNIIQNHMNQGSSSYLATVVVDSLIKRNELSISSIRSTLPGLLKASLPFTVDEIAKRLKKMSSNYEKIAAELGKEFIKELIKETIKDKITAYLIKKIGKKIIPVVNVISAAQDVFDDEENRRIRHAVACVVLAVKGTVADDMTISAKVLSQIFTDKFIDAVKQVLISKGLKIVKGKMKGGSDDPDADNAPKKGNDTPETSDASPKPDSDLNKTLTTSKKPVDQPEKGTTKKPDTIQNTNSKGTTDTAADFKTKSADSTADTRLNRHTLQETKTAGNNPGTEDKGTKNPASNDKALQGSRGSSEKAGSGDGSRGGGKPPDQNNGGTGGNGPGSGGIPPRRNIPEHTSVMEYSDARTIINDLRNRSEHMRELQRISGIRDVDQRNYELGLFTALYSVDNSNNTKIRIEVVTDRQRQTEVGLVDGNYGSFHQEPGGGVIYIHGGAWNSPRAVNEVIHEVGAAELYRHYKLDKERIPLVLRDRNDPRPEDGDHLTHYIDVHFTSDPDGNFGED